MWLKHSLLSAYASHYSDVVWVTLIEAEYVSEILSEVTSRRSFFFFLFPAFSTKVYARQALHNSQQLISLSLWLAT
jgi:hypothetical protein